MKKLLLVFFILIQFSGYSQIKVGHIEEPVQKEHILTKESTPKYDSIQNFITYSEYCNSNEYQDTYHFNHKEGIGLCDMSDFYKRYVGLQIYFPDYKENYRNDEIRLFGLSGLDTISWKQAGDKTYVILDLYAGAKNFPKYDALKTKYPTLHFNENTESFNHALVFVLKSLTSNDTICVFENEITPQQKFILVPYFNCLRRLFLNKEFVQKGYDGCLVKPNLNQYFWLDDNKSIKCTDVIIVHNSQIYGDCVSRNCKSDDISILYKLVLDSTVYYLDETYNRGYNERLMPNILKYFVFKSDFDKQIKDENESSVRDENSRKNALIKRFGQEFGSLIYAKKLKIGMTKTMCDEVWGESVSCQKIITKQSESLVCKYEQGTLVFKNSILTKIVY